MTEILAVLRRATEAEASHRRRSMWLDLLDESLAPRPAPPAPAEVAVAIVGAGYTGLWTAYYLAPAGPQLRGLFARRRIDEP